MNPYDHTAAWINHYHTKTAEEFVEKVKRGFPDRPKDNDIYQKRAVEYFFKINERTAEKEEVLKALVNP